MSADEPTVEGEGCGVDAAPYVLGALTEVEVERFSAHLTTCAACREEVASLRVAVAVLPAAAPQLSAPGDLKRRVLDTVHREASLHGAGAPAPPSARRTAWARPRWSPAVVAAGFVATVAAVLVVVLAPGGGGSGSTRVIRAEVLAPRASATVRVSGGHAELNIAGMPQTAPNRVYEVWVERSGAPQPTDALFTVSDTGAATVGVPGSIGGVREILVTSEPRGGSRVPTRAPVIVARVS
jgi:anti-sigma-K factor RskA